MDIFRVPGAGLTSASDRDTFDDIKTIVDDCTNDILIRPDWEANLRIVDTFNGIDSMQLRAEVIFLLRRKLSSPKARTVYLTLSLVEALVKNGGNKVFAAVGNEAFMKEMAKVARKYNGRSGSENMEVSELSLDMIQGWGEAFLSKQREFPAFSKTYHDLRKEGIQFKAQYDVNRVPIFTPVGAHAGEATEDSGILKAAMEASMYSAGPSRSQTTGNPMSSFGATAQPKHSTECNAEDTSRKLVQSTNDVTQSMATSINILKEMISVCESAPALRDNEIADEVVVQLRSLQGAMTSVIDFELSQDGQNTEILFKINDDCQMLLEVYDAIMDGTCTLSQAAEIVATVGDFNDESIQPLPGKKGEQPDLFDFLDMSPSDSAVIPAAKAQEPVLHTLLPSKSTVTAPPSTFFDPFANDPVSFGPSNSSIDDLLASPPVASPKVDDFFGTLSTPSVTEQRKPLRFDPMQAFDAVPPIPFQQYSMPGMGSGASITSSSPNGDFHPFNVPGGMPMPIQQSFPQQAYGIHPSSAPDPFDPYSFQNRPQPSYQQGAYQGQQSPPQQSMPNPGYSPYQPSNNLIYNDGRQAPPINATGAPPSTPPPAAPQSHLQTHNPFDGL